MAIAVLAVKQRGVANGYCQVVRQAGATATQVGRSFTALWKGTGTLTGVFQVGETVTGGTSGATGKVTSIGGLNNANNIIISVLSGTFVTGESVTGGTSGAIYSTIQVGLSNNNSNGTWAPEPSAAANDNRAQNRVLQFKGSLYCFVSAAIWKYDGVNDWSIVHNLANPGTGATPTTNWHQHSGLHVLYVNNQPRIGAVYGMGNGTNFYRVSSVDGTTWSELSISTSYLFNGAGQWVSKEVVWNNVLYWLAQDNSNLRVASWDPANDGFTVYGSPNGNASHAADITVFQNQLILLSQKAGGQAALYSLLAGAWSEVLAFTDTGNISGGGFGPNNTTWTMFAPNDGSNGNFLYVVYMAFTNPQAGWVFKKVQYSGGVFTDLGQIQSAVLAGTGIPTYPSADGQGGRFYVVVDDVSTPGTSVVYLYYSANDTAGTTVQVMQWNGPTSAMTVIGSGGDIANALANVRQGGGERIWGPGQPDIIITNIASTPGGETISFIVFGGGTKTVQFFFSQLGQPPATQCTLASPVTGGGTLDGPNKQILTAPADGVTVQTVKWNAPADNAQNLTRAQLEPVCF